MKVKQPFQWSKETYERTLSSRCWYYTPYSEGWDACKEVSCDRELQRTVAMECALPNVPAWAAEIAERFIRYLPGCPHCAFPRPFLDVVDAIGAQSPPKFVHGCYTADGVRKRRMLDYIFCLDAWLAGATAEQAAAEIKPRGSERLDWPEVCQGIWRVLGVHTELKDLLVERLLHRQRWWVKSLVWEDDARDRYCQDQYLGDVHCQDRSQDRSDCYGNPPFADPFFVELQTAEVKRMESRLAEICPDWAWFREMIHCSWLCAPKAFRFLERALWSIGLERKAVFLPGHPLENAVNVPDFLQCADTYPDRGEAEKWLLSFADGMRRWLSGKPLNGQVQTDVSKRLGEQTPVKAWLVRLYLRKLELLNPYSVFSRPSAAS
jgi:hypothetical protein